MNSFSPKQRYAFRNSNARLNIFHGSVSSGKSHIALYAYLEDLRKASMGESPQGPGIVSGKSESTIIRNVLRPMDHEVGGIIKYNQQRREFTLWGTTNYIIGANDERSEGKIRGMTAARALVDEGTLIPESYFKMLLSRLRMPGAKAFITTNPDSKFHWLYTDYIQKFADDPDELFSVPFRLDDNPSLDESYKEALKKEYSGLWYRRFINGEWVQAEGAVYDFFEHEIHTVREAPTYAKYYIVGIDYGTTNPFAAILIGFNDDCHPAIWVEKELYWDSRATGHQRTDAEYGEMVYHAFHEYQPKMFYVDPSAASFILELKRRRMPVTQANNDVLDGIRAISSYISQGDLVIKRRCKNLIKEFESYVWDEKSLKSGDDKVVKQRDHCLDALRYGVYTHFGKRFTLRETKEKRLSDHFGQNPLSYTGFAPSHGWESSGFCPTI